MSAQRQPDDFQYRVGDRVVVSLSGGRFKEATIRAIIYFEGGAQVQVDFGNNVTTLVNLSQIRLQDQ